MSLLIENAKNTLKLKEVFVEARRIVEELNQTPPGGTMADFDELMESIKEPLGYIVTTMAAYPEQLDHVTEAVQVTLHAVRSNDTDAMWKSVLKPNGLFATMEHAVEQMLTPPPQL